MEIYKIIGLIISFLGVVTTWIIFYLNNKSKNNKENKELKIMKDNESNQIKKEKIELLNGLKKYKDLIHFTDGEFQNLLVKTMNIYYENEEIKSLANKIIDILPGYCNDLYNDLKSMVGNLLKLIEEDIKSLQK